MRLRTEVSKKNPYYISRHRFLELKHFCAQYPEWRELYFLAKTQTMGEEKDPTGFYASVMADCQKNMELVRNVSHAVDKVIGPYIFLHVTRGDSFDKLLACDGIPCCRESFYIFLRQFYHDLSLEKS